jgi:hypothetical protein
MIPSRIYNDIIPDIVIWHYVPKGLTMVLQTLLPSDWRRKMFAGPFQQFFLERSTGVNRLFDNLQGKDLIQICQIGFLHD